MVHLKGGWSEQSLVPLPPLWCFLPSVPPLHTPLLFCRGLSHCPGYMGYCCYITLDYLQMSALSTAARAFCPSFWLDDKQKTIIHLFNEFICSAFWHCRLEAPSTPHSPVATATYTSAIPLTSPSPQPTPSAMTVHSPPKTHSKPDKPSVSSHPCTHDSL